ncbi:hypothetical protein GCM10022252_79960 [Streptosporangium oxazolinicum]|uniref:Uncharacterized protein n=1 Tax=Streptosporangium oxazolinicum TaxID=909287 RepID=A0ABP8BNW3_9ACTN
MTAFLPGFPENPGHAGNPGSAGRAGTSERNRQVFMDAISLRSGAPTAVAVLR